MENQKKNPSEMTLFKSCFWIPQPPIEILINLVVFIKLYSIFNNFEYGLNI